MRERENETIKRLEKFDFIREGKPVQKLNISVLVTDQEQGGLRMTDIERFIRSQKVSWIKRLLQPESKSLLKTLLFFI